MIVLIAALVGLFVYCAFQSGYRAGYAACDFEHDFDRCPHCGE